MKERWTGNIVGRMHVYEIKAEDLAKRCGYSPQYLSMVLNGRKKFTTEEGKEHTKRIIFDSISSIEKEQRHE